MAAGFQLQYFPNQFLITYAPIVFGMRISVKIILINYLIVLMIIERKNLNRYLALNPF